MSLLAALTNQENKMRITWAFKVQVHSSEKGSPLWTGGPNSLSSILGRGDLAKVKKAGRTISPGHSKWKSTSVEVEPTLLLLPGNE